MKPEARTIGEIMSGEVRCCSVADRLDTAAQLMWEHDCGCVPVLHDDGKLAGMVTDRDVCMAAYTQGRPLADIAVTVAMTPSPVRVRAQDEPGAALDRLKEHCIRRLPVVDDDDGVVGIMSLADLVGCCNGGRAAVGVGAHDITRALGSICQPRNSQPRAA